MKVITQKIGKYDNVNLPPSARTLTMVLSPSFPKFGPLLVSSCVWSQTDSWFQLMGGEYNLLGFNSAEGCLVLKTDYIQECLGLESGLGLVELGVYGTFQDSS